MDNRSSVFFLGRGIKEVNVLAGTWALSHGRSVRVRVELHHDRSPMVDGG